MAQKIPSRVIGKHFVNWEFVVKETFNWELLYKRFYEFLQEEDWKDLQQGKDDYEIYHYQADLGGGAKSQDIWWRATRTPKDDMAGQLKFYLKLDFKTLAIKKKEIMHEGKKLELENGELTVRLWLYLDTQNDDKKAKEWKENFFLKLLHSWFWDKESKEKIERAEEELDKFSKDLQALLTKFTGAQKTDGPRDFLPPKGYSG